MNRTITRNERLRALILRDEDILRQLERADTEDQQVRIGIRNIKQRLAKNLKTLSRL